MFNKTSEENNYTNNLYTERICYLISIIFNSRVPEETNLKKYSLYRYAKHVLNKKPLGSRQEGSAKIDDNSNENNLYFNRDIEGYSQEYSNLGSGSDFKIDKSGSPNNQPSEAEQCLEKNLLQRADTMPIDTINKFLSNNSKNKFLIKKIKGDVQLSEFDEKELFGNAPVVDQNILPSVKVVNLNDHHKNMDIAKDCDENGNCDFHESKTLDPIPNSNGEKKNSNGNIATTLKANSNLKEKISSDSDSSDFNNDDNIKINRRPSIVFNRMPRESLKYIRERELTPKNQRKTTLEKTEELKLRLNSDEEESNGNNYNIERKRTLHHQNTKKQFEIRTSENSAIRLPLNCKLIIFT